MTINDMRTDKQVIEQLLEGTGIVIDGNKAWDLRVNNPQLYSRILAEGSLGFGEAYMEGWWDCDALDDFFYRILKLKPLSFLVDTTVPSACVRINTPKPDGQGYG